MAAPHVNSVLGQRAALTVLDVNYVHLRLSNNDDLYLTQYGMPFLENLLPECFWTDKEWFQSHSIPLHTGSSTVYKVQTKAVRGRSKDIVLKWNRMGQEIPGAETGENLLNAEFNSPYEEFALLSEMRNAEHESPGRILTHKPLAIYVPSRRVELWQSGRKKHKMQGKIRNHREIQLDMFRSYAMIYEWIKGVDAVEACRKGALSDSEMRRLTRQVEQEMKEIGFLVRDRKPHHIIVRLLENGSVLRKRKGNIPHAIVDFELLERTPEREEIVRKFKRKNYLQKQPHRFDSSQAVTPPPHLQSVNILGVDYIYGVAETTGGALWVVGKDPTLYDYFLPERWRWVPKKKLSDIDEIYRVVTKDNIQLVWKASRVGEKPDMDPFNENEKRILDYGYNSPFEEVAFAMELNRKGIPATYPRAVYMTGEKSKISNAFFDNSRYESHNDLGLLSMSPVLRKDHDYIIISGYWNKPDELLARNDSEYYRAIDALQVLREGILSERIYVKLMRKTKEQLAEAGIEDLNLRGHHKLLSIDSSGKFVEEADGLPTVRICNFEFLKKL